MFVVVQMPEKAGNHERLYLECEPSTTLYEVKEKVHGQKNIKPKLQKLKCQGILLSDDCTLDMYGIVASEAGGTAASVITLEVIIAGPIPLEESAALDAVWAETGGAGGRWKRSQGWHGRDRLLRPASARGVGVRLQYVVSLSMPDNNLAGAVPAALQQFSRLTELNLGYNQLTGGVPAALAECRALVRLSLQWNKLTGPLPAALFSNLQRLEHLYLDHNQLTGELPCTLGRCGALKRLALANNRFHGRVPFSIGLLEQLSVLWLMHNPELVIPYQVKLFSPAQEILKFYRWERVRQFASWDDR
eukprot:g1897.t1